MSFVSPDSVYFISFLIFVFCAYKYGHKAFKKVLDQQIQGITTSLSKAKEEKVIAHETLKKVRLELETFEQSLKDYDAELKERISDMTEKNRKEIDTLTSAREKHHSKLISFEREEHVSALKDELVASVIAEFEKRILADPILQENFQKQSVGLLKEYLSEKSFKA